MTDDYAPTPVEDFLDPDDPVLFPRLTPEQISYLAEIGTQARRRGHGRIGGLKTPHYETAQASTPDVRRITQET
jgi:hypothetical protein